MKEVIFYLGGEGYDELLEKKNVNSPKDPSPEPLAVFRDYKPIEPKKLTMADHYNFRKLNEMKLDEWKVAVAKWETMKELVPLDHKEWVRKKSICFKSEPTLLKPLQSSMRAYHKSTQLSIENDPVFVVSDQTIHNAIAAYERYYSRGLQTGQTAMSWEMEAQKAALMIKNPNSLEGIERFYYHLSKLGESGLKDRDRALALLQTCQTVIDFGSDEWRSITVKALVDALDFNFAKNRKDAMVREVAKAVISKVAEIDNKAWKEAGKTQNDRDFLRNLVPSESFLPLLKDHGSVLSKYFLGIMTRRLKQVSRERPVFSWSFSDAKFPSDKDFENFLRGPEESFTYTQRTMYQVKRNYITTWDAQQHGNEIISEIKKHSRGWRLVKAYPTEEGRRAKLELRKSRTRYEQMMEKYEANQAEAKVLNKHISEATQKFGTQETPKLAAAQPPPSTKSGNSKSTTKAKTSKTLQLSPSAETQGKTKVARVQPSPY
ncbi:hypothetical protein HDU76_001199 [Blyttiomyces sp. JEL0837]|nr:hypothetical protein HDU76_001199 [Blyttiomyces sp. JEL0837]